MQQLFYSESLCLSVLHIHQLKNTIVFNIREVSVPNCDNNKLIRTQNDEPVVISLSRGKTMIRIRLLS